MNTGTTAIVVRVMPIILLLGLGNLIRVKSILTAGAVEELKGLVVKVALPAVLFAAFLDMELERAYLGLFATILLVCLFLLGYGYLLRRLFSPQREYVPFLTTGFEFGMVGISHLAADYRDIPGYGGRFQASPAGSAILETFDLLGNLLIPAILIIIGYGMRLSHQGFRDAVAVVVSRFVVLLPLGFLVSRDGGISLYSRDDL